MFGWRFGWANWDWKHALAGVTGAVCTFAADASQVAPVLGPLGVKIAKGAGVACLLLTGASKALGVEWKKPEAPKT